MSRDEIEGIEARIAALAPGYLRRRIDDIESLREAQAADDRERIAAIGHNLRGTGASYGYQWISEIGARLEAAAYRNGDELERLIRELRDRIEAARVAPQAGQRRR